MLTAGRVLLIVALAIAVYGVLASLYGAHIRNTVGLGGPQRPRMDRLRAAGGVRAVRRARRLLRDPGGGVPALGLLVRAGRDSHSSTTTSTFYQATAIWSSQEGSLLFWVLLLSGWSSAILFLSRNRAREIAPYATAVLLGIAAFFVGLLVFLETPFGRLSPTPIEGAGLNPLLRHPAMMFHPPMLYSGYTLFTIPFAFAVGALITRRLGSDWLRTVRPFALAAWLCLGIGIVLGARWSYSELGWGGYWGWDAVENASLMPWLIGTAFLHSAMVQEKRGMLRYGTCRWCSRPASSPAGHVPGAVGDPQLDPRLRRVDPRASRSWS